MIYLPVVAVAVLLVVGPIAVIAWLARAEAEAEDAGDD